ncbi:hypothetical protein GCM10029992_39190 [Glycomyces albus]
MLGLETDPFRLLSTVLSFLFAWLKKLFRRDSKDHSKQVAPIDQGTPAHKIVIIIELHGHSAGPESTVTMTTQNVIQRDEHNS